MDDNQYLRILDAATDVVNVYTDMLQMSQGLIIALMQIMDENDLHYPGIKAVIDKQQKILKKSLNAVRKLHEALGIEGGQNGSTKVQR